MKITTLNDRKIEALEKRLENLANKYNRAIAYIAAGGSSYWGEHYSEEIRKRCFIKEEEETRE